MAEQEAEHRRIVVETPHTRREVEQTEAVHHHDRSGVSGAALAAVVVGVIALAALVILFVLNQQQQTTNENLAAQQPSTTVVQQPAQQPPVIVQQPAPATQPAPVIITNPAPAGGSAPAVNGSDDASIQAAVDKRLSDDSVFSTLGITTTVLDGKVTLMGMVKTETLKAQIERAVRNVKGVKSVDNQIIIG